MQKKFNCKTKFLCGNKALERLSYELAYYNSSRVLVVVDKQFQDSGRYKIFTKAMAFSEVSLSVLTLDKELFYIESINKIITQYYSDECNAIVVIGGYRIVDMAKLARLAVSQNLVTFDEFKSVKGGVGNIPLVVVQSGVGGRNAATSSAYYFKSKREISIECGDELAPNAVVIDNRMAHCNKEEIIINSLYVIAMAFAATLDKLTVFHRGFVITALKLAREALYNDKLSMQSKKTTLISAVAYIGVGQNISEESLIGKLSFLISSQYNLDYKTIYYILTPYAMGMFMNRNSQMNTKILAALIGNDEVVKIPNDRRTVAMLDEMRRIYSDYKDRCHIPISLSELNIQPEQFEEIFNIGVEYKFFNDEVEIKRSITELLSRAL